MTITALPTPPTRSDPATFAARGDAFMTALPTFVAEANALAATVSADQATASTAASNASASQSAAASSASAASTSAATATTKASEASASASAASTSAANASNSAASASSSASAASTSAATATTKASEASASAAAASAIVLGVSTTLPVLRPTLNLNFASSQAVDPRITFTRASTATRYNAKGLVESVASDTPRIDYDPSTLACKGLLIEEARTNLLTYSEQFDNAAWTKSGSSITSNAVTAPDGTATADKLVESFGGTYHYVNQWPTLAATTHTFSIYAKASENSVLALDLYNATDGTATVFFNVASGTVGSTIDSFIGAVASGIQAIGNGWYRCWITATPSAVATRISVFLADGATETINYTGDGTSGLYIWGAQLEAGAFPTSYIPTVASQVTRAADVASMTGANFSSWYRQDEGSFVCDWAQSLTTSTADTFGLFRVSGTSGALPIISSRIGYVGFRRIRSYAQDTGAFFEYESEGNAETSNSGKFSLTYAATNDFATSSSGATVVTDTAGSISDFSCNTLQLGLATSQLNGHIARLAYYPKRCSNAELQALTA